MFGRPLLKHPVRGAGRKHQVIHTTAPLWELPSVLEALSKESFKPLRQTSLKALPIKAARLLALMSAKSV